MYEVPDNVFAIRESNLSAVSCDSVLTDLSTFVDRQTGGDVVLDLSELGFVDPYGMAMLCLIGRRPSDRFGKVGCRLPDDPKIESYLTRMRVFEELGKYVFLSGDPHTERPPAHNESLGSRFDTSSWSHGEAILKAARKEFSREAARGLGLYIVNGICQQYRGSLHIRSGNARAYFRGKRSHIHASDEFPGTQVSITLYEKV